MGPRAVGKSTLVEQLPLDGAPGAVQRRASAGAGDHAGAVKAAAVHGTAGVPGALPFRDTIQRAFGRHDVSRVGAHVGGAAAEASARMGAEAYAVGDRVAFASAPTLHTAAHEAAHVIQQRAGVQLKGGIGAVGDTYERHADAVADRVMQGRSAEDLLDDFAPADAGGSTAVQRKVTVADKPLESLESLDEKIAPTERTQQVLREMILADPTYAFGDAKELAEFVADVARTAWGPPPTDDKRSQDDRVRDFTKARLGQHLWASDYREQGDLRVTRTNTLNEMFQGRAEKAKVLGMHGSVGTTVEDRPSQQHDGPHRTQHVYSAMMTSLSPAANDKERQQANKDVHDPNSVMNCEQFVAYSLWGGGVIKDWELALIFAACARQNNMAFLYQAMGFNIAKPATPKDGSLGLTSVCVLFEVNDRKPVKKKPKSTPTNSKKRHQQRPMKQNQMIEPSDDKQLIEPSNNKQLIEPSDNKQLIEPSNNEPLIEPSDNKQLIEPNQQIEVNQPVPQRAQSTQVAHMLLYTGGNVVELNSGSKQLSEWQATAFEESVYANRRALSQKLIYACPVADIPKELQATLAEIAHTFPGGQLLAPKPTDKQPTDSQNNFGFLKFEQQR